MVRTRTDFSNGSLATPMSSFIEALKEYQIMVFNVSRASRPPFSNDPLPRLRQCTETHTTHEKDSFSLLLFRNRHLLVRYRPSHSLQDLCGLPDVRGRWTLEARFTNKTPDCYGSSHKSLTSPAIRFQNVLTYQITLSEMSTAVAITCRCGGKPDDQEKRGSSGFPGRLKCQATQSHPDLLIPPPGILDKG